MELVLERLRGKILKNKCSKSSIWYALEQHANELYDNETKQSCVLNACTLQLDYSTQKIKTATIDLLIALANACNLKKQIENLVSGKIVNESQQLPAMHTALRMESSSLLNSMMPQIPLIREQMKDIAEKIRGRRWLGYSGKPITSIVNIGIGGSDLGPRFCVNALEKYSAEHLDYHFISDADPRAFDRVVKKLNPETTLFIISSKSFSTYETLHNAKKAMAWIGEHANKQQHFIAVTANEKKAEEFGIATILPIWDCIGGRYSLCSAINLISCIAIGYAAFSELLAGAHSMDKHFYESELHENMPVIMALLGIWNINFLHISNLLVLVYAQQLELFVPYIQQLDMESNGKSVDKYGNFL